MTASHATTLCPLAVALPHGTPSCMFNSHPHGVPSLNNFNIQSMKSLASMCFARDHWLCGFAPHFSCWQAPWLLSSVVAVIVIYVVAVIVIHVRVPVNLANRVWRATNAIGFDLLCKKRKQAAVRMSTLLRGIGKGCLLTECGAQWQHGQQGRPGAAQQFTHVGRMGDIIARVGLNVNELICLMYSFNVRGT